MLTYARSLRMRDDSLQAAKISLIQRGNLLVLFVILVTLVGDAIAVSLHPWSPSAWGNILLIELTLMFLLVVICVLALMITFGRMPTQIPANDLTPADAIDDMWTLVRVPVTLLSTVLPSEVVGWVKRFSSDRLFARAPWVNPRPHPWRFASLLGGCMGVCLVLVKLQEGLPPNWQAALLVAGIFISAEFAATLAGFALFGGYLGLRPSFDTRG